MDVNIFGFMPALLPVALSPGASFTLVMNSALAGGNKDLFRTLAGTALGIYTHAFFIGLGITAVLISSPAAFAVLKVTGTVYRNSISPASPFFMRFDPISSVLEVRFLSSQLIVLHALPIR
ncbi:LysE family transporter [Pseudomonas cerasi]